MRAACLPGVGAHATARGRMHGPPNIPPCKTKLEIPAARETRYGTVVEHHPKRSHHFVGARQVRREGTRVLTNNRPPPGDRLEVEYRLERHQAVGEHTVHDDHRRCLGHFLGQLPLTLVSLERGMRGRAGGKKKSGIEVRATLLPSPIIDCHGSFFFCFFFLSKTSGHRGTRRGGECMSMDGWIVRAILDSTPRSGNVRRGQKRFRRNDPRYALRHSPHTGQTYLPKRLRVIVFICCMYSIQPCCIMMIQKLRTLWCHPSSSFLVRW